MTHDLRETIALYLFVPADRPERFAKAFAAGADAVIIDLEDAVAQSAKVAARRSLEEAEGRIAEAPCPVVLRINAVGSHFHSADVELVSRLPFAGTMLPKAETADDVARLADTTGRPVISLIETAVGLTRARSIAATGTRLAFGSIDFAADLGCAHTRDALLAARSELVLASRLADGPSAVDGVTTNVKDPSLVEEDLRYAVSLGMGGKLLIHPAQIGAARQGLRPTFEEVAWAARVLAAFDGGAAAVDGSMIDAPVRLRAEQIVRRIDRFERP